MKVELTITLDVEAVEDNSAMTDKRRVLRSVREAIEHAIRYGQGEGHVHEMSDSISIMLGEVGEAVDVTTGCVRCGSDLDPAGECVDCTCPFSNHKQDCPAGWQGHPEHKAGGCTCKGQP